LALLSPPPLAEKKKKRRVGEVGGRCGLVHTASSSYPVLCGRSPQTKGAHKRFQTSRLPLSDPFFFFFSPLFYITSGICVCFLLSFLIMNYSDIQQTHSSPRFFLSFFLSFRV
jgi:hypothetical protein